MGEEQFLACKTTKAIRERCQSCFSPFYCMQVTHLRVSAALRSFIPAPVIHHCSIHQSRTLDSPQKAHITTWGFGGTVSHSYNSDAEKSSFTSHFWSQSFGCIFFMFSENAYRVRPLLKSLGLLLWYDPARWKVWERSWKETKYCYKVMHFNTVFDQKAVFLWRSFHWLKPQRIIEVYRYLKKKQ